LLATLGTYTRRTTVTGQVQSSDGLLRVTATQAGTVIEKKVLDGQLVERGALLFVLSADRMGADAISYQGAISAQIESRRRTLEDDMRRSSQNEQQETEQLKRRLDSQRSEQDQVIKLGKQLEARVRSLEETFVRYEALQKQDFVSKDEFLGKQNELNEMRLRQQAASRDLLTLERDALATQRDLDGLRNRYKTQRSELERAVLTTRQEYSELEARRRVLVTAPVAGKVSLVQAELGQSVESGRALVQIVPNDSRLLVRLYAPSKAAGFIKVGSPTLLRVDAFPYQKYGQFEGVVESVSSAALDAAELQTMGARTDAINEPVFTVVVNLLDKRLNSESSVEQLLKLQPGMKVEADLLHETRQLYEWILEPLYAAKSRIATTKK
jgi:membrane fusion protein